MTKSFSAPLELITVTHQKKAHWEFIPNTKKKQKTKRPRCLHVSYNQWRTVCIAAKMSCKSEAAPGGLTQQSAQFGLKCSPRREGSGSQITTSGTVSHFPPKTQKISCCALVEKGRKRRSNGWKGPTEPSPNTTMLLILSALKLKLKQEAVRTSISRCRTLTLSVALCWHWRWPGSF